MPQILKTLAGSDSGTSVYRYKKDQSKTPLQISF